MDIKTAMLGTDYQELVGSERDILIAALTESMRVQAGYVPKQGVFVDAEAISPQGQLIPFPIKPFYNDHVGLLAEHFHGYGWIAGSAALYAYDTPAHDRWLYNDIDVFCFSKSAYETLIKTSRIPEKSNDRQTVFSGYGFIVNGQRIWLDTDVNFVCPSENDDWSHPANVLNGFDLTITQVAIIQSGAAYVMKPEDIENQVVDYTGESIAPVATMRRIFKYLQRGYRADGALWYHLAYDNRMLPVLSLFESLAQFDAETQKEVLQGIFYAVPSDNDVEYSYGSDDD